jgi:chromosome partitioning protein
VGAAKLPFQTAGKVITVATTKGGAGKTTLVRLILGLLALLGRKVAGVDSDFNKNLFNWVTVIAKGKYAITIREELDESKIIALIQELLENHDLVVIDTAGAAVQATIFAIGCSDFVIIPVGPGSDDVVEAIKTYKLVQSASQMMRREIPTAVVLIGFKANTSIEEQIVKQLTAAKLPILKSRLTDLVAFPEMTLTGNVPTTGAAGREAAALLVEIASYGVLPDEPAKQEKLAS